MISHDLFRYDRAVRLAVLCILLMTGCGSAETKESGIGSQYPEESSMGEADMTSNEDVGKEDNISGNILSEKLQKMEMPAEESDEEGSIRNDPESEMMEELPTEENEMMEELPTEENGMLEIYADRGVISIPDDMMIAQISPQEILSGNPILYDRFRIDGWVFEWLISDDYDEESWGWLEDGVLVISREGVAEEMQVIHVTGEGGNAGWWVSVENKFEYIDVNFDDIPDFLVCTGHHGAQGLLTYYCFLQTENGFVEAPTFTDIPNPAIDADNQLILSTWRNSGSSHSWAEYECRDNTYVMIRELCEYCEFGNYDNEDVWVWTVNGEVIGRSDELSESESDDLLSEWEISGARWRSLFMD